MDPDAGLSFDPSQITISAESTVFWTNDDAIEHTVTSDEGSIQVQYRQETHLIIHLILLENLVIIVPFIHS
ncbi:MAG: hypothetical protein MRJ93_04885 [Nitrososphaeraceae archaeon]|nr:hypothetical protein [Nitrososphaeraceae archaeon]